MKSAIVAAAVGLAMAGVSLSSVAACAAPSTRVPTKALLTTLVQGNTVCVAKVPPQPDPPRPMWQWEWQEMHQAGGALIDYKRGPGDPVDPSKQVGTWSITGIDGRGVYVTYNYGGGSIFTYSVWDNHDSSYSLCSANPEIKAAIKPGGGAC